MTRGAARASALSPAPARPPRISLFWRTFLLLALLIGASLGATLGIAELLERTPPEQRLAWEVASVVNLTRSALVSAEPQRRPALLEELAREEDVGVLPKEPEDSIDDSATGPRLRALQPYLRPLLGPGTRVAGRVNGIDAVWISFEIDGDDYWLILPRARVERQFGPNLGLLGLTAAGLSLLGALAISRLVNRPLADLSRAIAALSRGKAPAPLADSGPTEIAAVNRRFNRLARELARLEEDRSLALAGISHDIRSPLARLRMEIELADVSAGQRASMAEDIERIDRIVGQFIQYARIAEPPRAERVDVVAALAAVDHAYRPAIEAGELLLSIDAGDARQWIGDPTDLHRAVSNLLDNAVRYGRPAPDRPARVELAARALDAGIAITVRDHGAGVPDDACERLLQPFARMDGERSERGGSGLGLAIVERLARRYGGQLRLINAAGGGLQASLILPDHGTNMEAAA
jgi:two-component system osmolarity sensor histidine kinase EnvZ